MIFVDSNVPMYLVGAPHPHKTDSQRLLERAIADRRRLVTSAEVLQEILHRYVAIQRPDAVQPAFDALLGLVDEVYPVVRADVIEAKEIVAGLVGVSARDAIHVAVMRHRGVSSVMSFDRAFDDVPGLERIA